MYVDKTTVTGYVEQPMPKGCENFNVHDFFLSGGSSNPQSINDVQYELRRLQWLCSGGTKQ